MKMHKITPLNDGPMASYEGKNVKIYPSLSLTEADLPEIKDWAVGDEYDLAIHVKMTSQEETPSGMQGRFEMLKVGAEQDSETND